MNKDTFNKENMTLNADSAPSSDLAALPSELALIKDKIEALRKETFTGAYGDKEEPICLIKLNSQYEQIEKPEFISTFLLNLLTEEQITKIQAASHLEIDQLIHICTSLGEAVKESLGESIKTAFNEAREKSKTSAEKVFNILMETMQEKFKEE